MQSTITSSIQNESFSSYSVSFSRKSSSCKTSENESIIGDSSDISNARNDHTIIINDQKKDISHSSSDYYQEKDFISIKSDSSSIKNIYAKAKVKRTASLRFSLNNVNLKHYISN